MSNNVSLDALFDETANHRLVPPPQVRSGKCAAIIADVDGVTVATISGSVDAVSVEEFDGHLAVACGDGARRLVIDLSDVDYLSAGGIAVLHGVARRIANAGGALAVSGGRAVSRPLRRTGLTRLIPVFDWLPKAFDSVGGIPPDH